MSRMIVTNTKVQKEPYRMKESGHLLYSYEELCYYIYSRMSLWVMEKERIGLTSWLLACGVPVNDIDTMAPYEAAYEILRAGTYFRMDEKRQMLDKMKKYPEFPVSYVEKDKGDLYLSYGKMKKAYFCYAKAAASLMGQESDAWRGSLYHNMGIVCCRFFYWDEAKKWFEKAMEISEAPETKMALDLVSDMQKKEWEFADSPVLTIEVQKKKKEFLNEL